MKTALVATEEQPLAYWGWDPDWNPVWIETTATPGTVINIINYDPNSGYTTPPGSEILEVDDSVQIGDNVY